jgi:hypothetical protein
MNTVAVGKRGQRPSSGGGAAVLIGVITLLIIMYIVFLPASERDDILSGTNNGGSNSGSSSFKRFNVTPLLVNPGQMDFNVNDRIEHLLPAVNLLTQTVGTILEEENNIYVKSGVFSKVPDKMTFNIDDLENTENVLISFNAVESMGRLMINVNGEEVFNSIIEESLAPVKVKKKFLKNSNTVEFSVSSPGVAFWRVNEFLLEKVKITADVKDTGRRESKSIFVVDAAEADNADTVKLTFVPECNPNEVGPLSVNLNGNILFEGIPDCGTPFVQQYESNYLRAGENVVEFHTKTGKYLLDRIEVETKLKRPRDFTYDFNLNGTVLKGIKDGDLKSNLSFTFIDDDDQKEALLILNGYKLVLSTDDAGYSRNVDVFLKDGFNYLKITPRKKMFVPEVKLHIQKE